MEKNEFPRFRDFKDFPPPEEESSLKPKLQWLQGKTFNIIKLVFGICLLMFVYSFAASFLGELKTIGKPLETEFWAGMISFVLFYFFVWEPALIYRKGFQLLEWLFKFFAPMFKIAPYVLPVYSILAFFIYVLLTFFVKNEDMVNYFVFIFGLTLAMHLVFSGKTLRGKKGDFLKSNYIFGFSFIFILNTLVAAFFMSLLFEKFSFVNFFNGGIKSAVDLFTMAFRQIFALN